jgi:uncharacterized protein GlcG (DUF336 family)
MRVLLLLVLMAASVAAQTLRHRSGEPVTFEYPAEAGEVLVLGVAASQVMLGLTTVDVSLNEAGEWEITVPEDVAGPFVELALIGAEGERQFVETVPVRGALEPGQLSAAEVDAIIQRAVMVYDSPRLTVAVVDRAGRHLGVYKRPEATASDVEDAIALARTAAFFSHNQAPLTSRTVQTLSKEHFPNDVPNQPAAALYGIEKTNRGCGFNAAYDAGKFIPPARTLDDQPGPGVATRPGGLPLFKSNGGGVVMAGGVGVGGVEPNAAEFAALVAVNIPEFFPDPKTLPYPGGVFIDGILLPEINQLTRPAGTQAAGAPGGEYVIAPRDGASAPDGWLISPKAGTALSADDVRSIVQRAVDRASRTRGLIRLPLGSRARMAISVADLDGTVLGLFRMPDATIFSNDVAVAKARNVIYFSSVDKDPRDLPGIPAGTAVTNRSIGFGAQPFFPSGINNSQPGPFFELFGYDQANPCTQGRQPKNANQNGIVFFPGSAPLYRNGVMVGGLGVSGDGVEQDDYVTAGGAQGFEPPAQMRADYVFIRGVRIPYWKFPRNPEQ